MAGTQRVRLADLLAVWAIFLQLGNLSSCQVRRGWTGAIFCDSTPRCQCSDHKARLWGWMFLQRLLCCDNRVGMQLVSE